MYNINLRGASWYNMNKRKNLCDRAFEYPLYFSKQIGFRLTLNL